MLCYALHREKSAEELKMQAFQCKSNMFKSLTQALTFAFEFWALAVFVDHNPVQYSVSLTMPCEFDSVMKSEESQKTFDESLRTQICTVLDVPRESICLLCRQRGSVKVEVVLSDVTNDDGTGVRSAQTLAKLLVRKSKDDKSSFASCGLQLCATQSQLHGPVSNALLETVIQYEGAVAERTISKQAAWEELNGRAWEELTRELEQERDNGKALAEADSARRRETCKRSVKRMLYIDLARAFDSFADRVVQVREKKGQCKWFIKRIQLARLAGAFALFSGAIERVVVRREAVWRAMSRWRTPELREMFWRWIEHVDDIKQEAVKESLAMARMKMAAAESQIESLTQLKIQNRAQIADLDSQLAVAQLEHVETQKKFKVCSHADFSLRITELQSQRKFLLR
jgi:hypothetical protein